MLLGLTILLVLLAWTLGNTIARSTDDSALDAFTDRMGHRLSVSQFVRYLYSRLPLSCAIGLLCRIELQAASATASPQGDVATAVASAGLFSERCALLIGRTSVGAFRHLSFAPRDTYESNRRSLLRTRGLRG